MSIDGLLVVVGQSRSEWYSCEAQTLTMLQKRKKKKESKQRWLK